LSHTPLEDIKLKNSEKLFAQSSKDSLAQCNSTEETLVKKSKPSESSDMLLKLFTYWLEETHCKFSLEPFKMQAQDKTPPESELEVLLENKLLTFPQSEE
jgi:hypothetical protein